MYDSDHAELISAYVDGQLDAAERAVAERLLAEQPALRQLRDDLIALRDKLTSLPQLKLPADFSSNVLQQAERAVLKGSGGNLGRAARDDGPATLPLAAPKRTDEIAAAPWRRFLRPAAWAMTAVAAAVVVSIMTREPKHNTVATVALGKNESRDDAMRSERPHVMTKGGEAGAVERRAEDMLESADERKDAPSQQAASRDADLAKEKSHLEADLPTPPASASSPTVGARRMRVPAEALPSKSAAGLSDKLADEGGDLLVVQCDVTAEVVEKNQLAAALSTQQIDFLADGDAEPLAANKKNDAERAKAGFDKAAGAEAALAERAEPSPVQLVYVEATPQQLHAALNELAQQPAQFVNINVLPPSTVAEEPEWTAYNRQNVAQTEPAGGKLAADRELLEQGRPSSAAAVADRPLDVTAPAAPAAAQTAQSAEQRGAEEVGQALQSAIGREVTQYRSQRQAEFQQANSQKARQALAERIALPQGNAVEQTVNSPAYQNAVQSQLSQQRSFNQLQKDAKQLQMKREAGREGAGQSVAGQADTGLAVEGAAGAAWQRAVFVLRVIEPLPTAVPAAAAPAAEQP